MIVIPMAGLSSRFFNAGFNEPKYMLEAHGRTLFDHSVSSFENYFDSKRFLFIVKDIYDTPAFVRQRVKELGIVNFDIVILKQDTKGQAETVTVGLDQITHEGSITIFNIDTFRPGFTYPDLKSLDDGYLEVFSGSGDNWSFVKPKNEFTTEVVQTAEKNPISDLCCTGLYHFNDVRDYICAYDHYLSLPKDQWAKGELYVAPLYNYLIGQGKLIHYNLINDNEVIFCGTPEEYMKFN